MGKIPNGDDPRPMQGRLQLISIKYLLLSANFYFYSVTNLLSIFK